MLAAPVCVLIPNRTFTRVLAVLASAGSFVSALALLAGVRESGAPIHYALGGWAPPLGIELRITLLSAFVIATISFISTVVIAFEARGLSASGLRDKKLNLFYAAYLLALTGLIGMVATNDLFNVFVFLEISSLASYSIISLGKDRRALVAAYSYLLIGTVGATFYLLGVGLLYQVTGTLHMLDLAARLPEVAHLRSVSVGFVFLMVGLFHQASRVSAASMAAQRLHPCSCKGCGHAGWHRHEGFVLRPLAGDLHNLSAQLLCSDNWGLIESCYHSRYWPCSWVQRLRSTRPICADSWLTRALLRLAT